MKIIDSSDFKLYDTQKMLQSSFDSTYGLYTIGVPYYQAVAERLVSGSIHWVKTGYNAALSNSEEDLWGIGGIYTYPTASMQMKVNASSINDHITGTGARQVSIYYLDTSFKEYTETVNLVGSGSANTVATNIYRVNRFRVSSCGTLGQTAGNITLTNVSGNISYSIIEAGLNAARDIHYTVPKNKTLFVTSIYGGVGSKTSGRAARFVTKTTYDSAAEVRRSFFLPYTDLVLQDSSMYVDLEVPSRLPEGTDIRVSATSPDGETYGTCTLRGILKSN